MENIAKQGNEISNIITELLEFAQPSSPKPSILSIESLITEAAKSKVEVVDAEIVVVEKQLADDLPDVFVDAEQIGLALAELIANAIESYEGNEGSVTITARFEELQEEVILEIADQGCGMDEETLRKAADPFFSVKRAGRKRGLGLSRCIRHIENNGGKLRLQSEPGKGSCVRVILPMAQVSAPDELAVS